MIRYFTTGIVFLLLCIPLHIHAQDETLASTAPAERIHVMIIDGGQPDHSHPWFKDADSRQVTQSTDPVLINEGFRHALTTDGHSFLANRSLTQQDVLGHWAARWYLGLRDGRVGQLIRKVLSLKIVSSVSLVVGLGSQLLPPWFGYDVTPWHTLLTSGLGWSVSTFAMAMGTRLGLPYLPHGIYYASKPFRRWFSSKDTPPTAQPIEDIPLVVRLAEDMRHPTHVTGTLAGDDSAKSKELKRDLVIHNLGFDELGLSDEAFRIGPVDSDEIQGPIDGSGGPRTAQSQAAVRDFLTGFFRAQKIFFQNLVRYINDNKIRSVNMSYGANAFDVRAALAKFLAGRDGMHIAYADHVSEYMTSLQRESYRFLFQNCPNTIFFVAAGNDTAPVHRGKELFTEVDGPNVFVSGASDDLLRMAYFSNYSESRVDSFGLGVDRVSALPYGRTGKMSGTSMASPYNMALDLLLMRIDRTLSTDQRMEILRRGSVKVANMSYASLSGGVSVAPLVVAQYLFREVKKRGYLSEVDDIAPILIVHIPKAKGKNEGSSPADMPSIRVVEERNQRTVQNLVDRIHQSQVVVPEGMVTYETAKKVKLPDAFAQFEPRARAEVSAKPPEPEPYNPFAITEQVIQILGGFLALIEQGKATEDLHKKVTGAMHVLNLQQMQEQASLIRYFVTPEDPQFHASDIKITIDRLPIQWEEFRDNVLSTENLRTRSVLFPISEFLMHGQRLTEAQASELMGLLIQHKHRFNTLIYVGQLILKHSSVDLVLPNPGRRNQPERVSELVRRANDKFPDPPVGCAPWS